MQTGGEGVGHTSCTARIMNDFDRGVRVHKDHTRVCEFVDLHKHAVQLTTQKQSMTAFLNIDNKRSHTWKTWPVWQFVKLKEQEKMATSATRRFCSKVASYVSEFLPQMSQQEKLKTVSLPSR